LEPSCQEADGFLMAIIVYRPAARSSKGSFDGNLKLSRQTNATRVPSRSFRLNSMITLEKIPGLQSGTPFYIHSPLISKYLCPAPEIRDALV
jgi:hypothetical protein